LSVKGEEIKGQAEESQAKKGCSDQRNEVVRHGGYGSLVERSKIARTAQQKNDCRFAWKYKERIVISDARGGVSCDSKGWV